MHVPVLLPEVTHGLAFKAGEIFLDATVGDGGHSAAVCERFGTALRIIGLDLDRDALTAAKDRLSGCAVILVNENFRHLDAVLKKLNVEHVHKILFDLGMSSRQLEASGRGFSFQRSGSLRMTFRVNPEPQDQTAFDIVNRFHLEELAELIKTLGEEHRARRIAKIIVSARRHAPIQTSGELAAIIEKALPRHGRLHPATRTFQALRIAVNDELNALREALPKAFSVLAPRGRLAVISFHSLEDTEVKYFFKSRADLGKLITKKPIVPTPAERRLNPRSRSAKLRIIEKV